MTEWTDGYHRALDDVRHLARRRSLPAPGLDDLLDDLIGDALVIEREAELRLRRRRLRAEREALPLFDKDNAP